MLSRRLASQPSSESAGEVLVEEIGHHENSQWQDIFYEGATGSYDLPTYQFQTEHDLRIICCVLRSRVFLFRPCKLFVLVQFERSRQRFDRTVNHAGIVPTL